MSVPSCSFYVPGVPAPQGSKKVVGNRLIEDSRRVYQWREIVGWVARKNYRGNPLDGAVLIGLTFVMPRTKAMGKNPPPPMIQKPDIDKLTRAVLDALTGIVFVDDSQVTHLNVVKRRANHGEETGVFIMVREREI